MSAPCCVCDVYGDNNNGATGSHGLGVAFRGAALHNSNNSGPVGRTKSGPFSPSHSAPVSRAAGTQVATRFVADLANLGTTKLVCLFLSGLLGWLASWLASWLQQQR